MRSLPVTQAIYLLKIRRDRQGRNFSHCLFFHERAILSCSLFECSIPDFFWNIAYFGGMVQLTLTRHTLWCSMMWFSEILCFEMTFADISLKTYLQLFEVEMVTYINLMNKVKTFSLLLFFLAFFSVSDWFCSGVLFEASCLLYDSNTPYLEFGLKCQPSLLNYPLAQLVTKGI